MASSPMNIASIIQSASLNRHPSPAHDINPSTAASIKRPVSPTISISSDDHSIPYSALKPVPRRSNLPPLPDLRFEQSYLASLRAVEGWQGVLWVTARDQVCQGSHKLISIRSAGPSPADYLFFLCGLGFPTAGAGHGMDACFGRLAILEQRS